MRIPKRHIFTLASAQKKLHLKSNISNICLFCQNPVGCWQVGDLSKLVRGPKLKAKAFLKQEQGARQPRHMRVCQRTLLSLPPGTSIYILQPAEHHTHILKQFQAHTVNYSTGGCSSCYDCPEVKFNPPVCLILNSSQAHEAMVSQEGPSWVPFDPTDHLDFSLG